MIATILFQVADTAAVNNERLAIILGILTLISAVAVFASCRTCIAWVSRSGIKNPANIKGYAFFYKNHLYYWWTFGVLVVAHFLIAVLHTGLPQSNDPDANIHWEILSLGFFSAISAASVFFSCRILPRLMAMATAKKPLNNLSYRSYYKYHSYYWLLVALLVAAHFIISFNHAGIWPSG